MFIFSIIYLLGAILLTLFGKIKFDWTSLFNTDGLTLFGAIYAFLQLILNKQSRVNHFINEKIIKNKMISFKLDILLDIKSSEQQILNLKNTFDESLKLFMNKDTLNIKSESILKAKCVYKYKDLFSTVSYILNDEDREILISIDGGLKYGTLNERKTLNNNSIFLTELVSFIVLNFLDNEVINKIATIKQLELVIDLQNSEIGISNLYNNELNINYEIKNNSLEIERDKSTIIISNKFIEIKSLAKGSLYESFKDLRDIVCNIN